MKKTRNSSLELLRLFSMLCIIAGHYASVGHGGFMFSVDTFNLQLIFLQCAGMFSRTACVVYILISSYFLCEIRGGVAYRMESDFQ